MAKKTQSAEVFFGNDQVGLCANAKLDLHLTEPGAENVTTTLGDIAPTDPDDMRNTDLKRKMCENVSGNGFANADMQCETPAVEIGGMRQLTCECWKRPECLRNGLGTMSYRNPVRRKRFLYSLPKRFHGQWHREKVRLKVFVLI